MSEEQQKLADLLRAGVSEAARAWRVVEAVRAGTTQQDGRSELRTCVTLVGVAHAAACDEMEAAIDRGEPAAVRAWMACVDGMRKAYNATLLAQDVLLAYERRVENRFEDCVFVTEAAHE